MVLLDSSHRQLRGAVRFRNEKQLRVGGIDGGSGYAQMEKTARSLALYNGHA